MFSVTGGKTPASEYRVRNKWKQDTDMHARIYRDLFLILLAIVVLLIAGNVAAHYYLEAQISALGEREAEKRRKAWAFERFQEQRAEHWLDTYGPEVLARVYPGKTHAEIESLVKTHSAIRFIYEPFAEHRHPQLTDPNLHIHDEGFRLVGRNQGPWPLDENALNIFIFGGSTTLGGGVADHETIPAQLQNILRRNQNTKPINIYNFGVGSYFSTQEITLFQNKIREGLKPDIVVFIDGLNDFYFWNGESAVAGVYRNAYAEFQNRSVAGVQQIDFWHTLGLLWSSLPVVRLANQLALSRETDASIATKDRHSPVVRGISDIELSEAIRQRTQQTTDEALDRVIARYEANVAIAEAIADKYGILPIFVWQPVPVYQYPLDLHPYAISNEHLRVGLAYPRMAERVAKSKPARNFVWCADVFSDSKTGKYVDSVHYTAEGNRDIATCVAAQLVGLLTQSDSRVSD